MDLKTFTEQHHRTARPGFGARLRQLRSAKRLSQTDLALRMRAIDDGTWNASTISRLESGDRDPQPETIQVIAAALELSGRERFEFMAAAGYLPPEITDDLLDRVWRAIEAEVAA